MLDLVLEQTKKLLIYRLTALLASKPRRGFVILDRCIESTYVNSYFFQYIPAFESV